MYRGLRYAWLPVDRLEIISGGRLGGRMALAGAGFSQLLLAGASVRPVQGLYGGYRDRLVVHGKEKVYDVLYRQQRRRTPRRLTRAGPAWKQNPSGSCRSGVERIPG
jgi:hypothetical protein